MPVITGYKHIAGNCKYVLITGIKYMGYMATVFQYSVLITGVVISDIYCNTQNKLRCNGKYFQAKFDSES